MWTVVYVAVGKEKAEFFKQLLNTEGILAGLRPAGNGAACNAAYEVIVPASEAEEAQAVLMQNLAR